MATKSGVMASSIGSLPWLDQENQQVAQFASQEADDFAFSVRNEMDFLNEHMAEIFSKNQVNITEVFKTPGKLRGKTPRTARKRNPLEIREPLNDIFAPKISTTASPSRGPTFSKEEGTFQPAKDAVLPPVDNKVAKNSDSGYHGMTEDEMDVDDQAPTATLKPPGKEETASPAHLEAPRRRRSQEHSALDGSFHSAKEDLTRETSKEPSHTIETSSITPHARASEILEPTTGLSLPQPEHASLGDAKDLVLGMVEKGSLMDEEDLGNDSLRSPSEGSSPAAKGLVRKSSLTFATLPAREPLTTKKSIGARISRTSHVDAMKGVMSRGSFLGRITGGKSLGGARQPESGLEVDDNGQMDVDGRQGPEIADEDSDIKAETKLHNKSSTQRLHDKISLLGKSQPTRPTKTIPPTAAPPQTIYPELPIAFTTQGEAQRFSGEDGDEEDWIQPPSKEAHKSPRPQLSKSISADVMENLRGKTHISDEDFEKEQRQSPLRHSLESERPSLSFAPPSQPFLGNAAGSHKANGAQQTIPSSTPVGTPTSTRHIDGPISASKSKLQSIMKTARGLFTSSAGASAQAKMELRNQAKIGSPNTTSPTKPMQSSKDIDLYPSLQMDHFNIISSARPENTAKPAEGRRTRGSIEKEKKEKERQRADMALQKPQEEIQKMIESKQEDVRDDRKAPDSREDHPSTSSAQSLKPAQQSPNKTSRPLLDAQHRASVVETMSDHARDTVNGKVTHPPPTSQQSQPLKPRDTKRPVRPIKETAPRAEPQRVAIRVGTLSQRIPISNAAISSGLQDSLPPPPPTKQPALAKKTSTASIQTTASNNGLRSATASKPKALIAAEKKKEQDEREAQRKVEQKREIERKRAAQQEETRRQEQLQRREAERQREQDRAAAAEDPKKIAQRQAIEKRRQELAKKDQQHLPPNPRPELGGARPPAKLQTAHEHSRPNVNHQPAPNPAKAPVKRMFESEVDEVVRQSRLPGGHPYQANEAKRRRTNDETSEEPVVRPTMVPPKRQSNLLKDAQRPYGPSLMGPPSSMANGYPHIKPPVTNHTYQSQYQHQAQSSRPGQAPQDMAKYTNGRIVFAENVNPAYPAHKTPNQARLTGQPLAKSSPQYMNGENIQLEDIPTDSDEDDSEEEGNKKAKGAMLPSWVQSPVLNELLREQEKNKDPDSIFGPSAAVNMEDMFKERHHRFRSRTSSANWAGNDRLTEEEIRSDNAAREKMRREGGWTFGL
ncbi:MAG: hypothetical protein Q9219_003850 [cf. Caloplaca sp. 3 TL-2023]